MIKIYLTILEVKRNNIPKSPGIYYFRNKINNKYYIGQTTKLNERFQRHKYEIIHKSEKCVIYKAFLKYGIENFEYGIIEILPNADKRLLDNKEVYYIKYYNSYYRGYNQTIGGESTIGYKYTKEQRELRSKNSKERASDGRFKVYLYDIINNKIYNFPNARYAAIKLNLSISKINYYRKHNKLYNNRYLVDNNEENILIRSKNIITPKRNKVNLNEYSKFRNNHLNMSTKDLAEFFNVSPDTILSYDSKLGYKSTDKRNKSRLIYKMLDVETKEIQTITSNEGSKLFNLSSHSFTQMVNRCIKNNTLYKKKFKFLEKCRITTN